MDKFVIGNIPNEIGCSNPKFLNIFSLAYITVVWCILKGQTSNFFFLFSPFSWFNYDKAKIFSFTVQIWRKYLNMLETLHTAHCVLGNILAFP